MKNSKYKNKTFFKYKGSYYHRKKELNEDGTTKYGRIGGFKTPKEAEESYLKHLEIYEEQKKKFLIAKIDKDICLIEYMNYWFENYSKRVECSTKAVTSYAIYNLILPNLSYNIKMRLATTEYFEQLLDKIDKIGKTTANKAREVLTAVMKSAIQERIITANPIDNLKKYKRGTRNVTIFDKSEMEKFLEITFNGNWYLEILLGLFCGLRKNEILSLKFDDFDLENKTVRITKQLALDYQMEENRYRIIERNIIEKNPKTENSVRTLRVPQIILDELKERKKIIEKRKKCSSSYIDNGYISCQENGLPHWPSSFNQYLSKTCKRNSLPIISVHSLRHMYATILIEQGVSLPKISALLGHSSIHTTFDYYCDVIEEDKKIVTFMNNNFFEEE